MYKKLGRSKSLSLVLMASLLASMGMGFTSPKASAGAQAPIDLVGPTGSGRFGTSVTILPNGYFVVGDPFYTAGTTANAGAVYLYNDVTGALISSLTGSTVGDQVGSGGITVLSNGNYIVSSPGWANGGTTTAGAVTWCSGTAGCTGVVSTANSLVGSQANDLVSSAGVIVLGNGNYVVRSPNWAKGGTTTAGAVTWCGSATGCTGAVSEANSLVGSQANDIVSSGGVIILSNGNYVVRSPNWANSGAAKAGAATWCSGVAGCTGAVSATNSLVGSQANDIISSCANFCGITPLSNGNYVVSSANWANGGIVKAGAATWCSGAAGCTGVVSAANSLVGSQANDQVSFNNIRALSNGNYIVLSSLWSNGGVLSAGAATWCSGATGCMGVISPANSLVGIAAGNMVGFDAVLLSNGNYVIRSFWANGAVTWCSGVVGCTGAVSATNSLVGSASDQVNSRGVIPLSNGNYVVLSPHWINGGAANAGAATWCNGIAGCTGTVSAANSLVGSQAGDQVSSGGVTVLSNGNYIVTSPTWANGGAANAGAATWCSGVAGCTDAVSTGNSLVGSTTGDQVGSSGATVLSNGNYAVRSPQWANSGAANAGAATWCSDAVSCTGAVSVANSLVGSTAGDQVSSGGITLLSNGAYVIRSPHWVNGGIANAGAATWCIGAAGCTGAVSATNSLVGSTAADQVSNGGAPAITGNYYAISSPNWTNGAVANAGAMTLLEGNTPIGPITTDNSFVGAQAGGGSFQIVRYSTTHRVLIFSSPIDNKVRIYHIPFQVYLPLIAHS